MDLFIKHCECCGGTGYVFDSAKMGAQLKTERKAAKITTTEIAKHLGISQQEVSKIEHGQRQLTNERVGDYRRAIVQALISPRSI